MDLWIIPVAVLFVIVTVMLIRRAWVWRIRGYVQLGILIVSEIAFICNRGIPCSNCPLSFGICPVGTVQRLAFMKHFPLWGTVILIGLTGLVLGTLTCAWACPIGFVQDLISAASWKKRKPYKNTNKGRWGMLSLLTFLLIIEWSFLSFSRAGINVLNEVTIYGGTVVLFFAFLEKRAFCRFLCPTGLIFGKLNRFSPVKIELNNCRSCGSCDEVCLSGLHPQEQVNNEFCVKCYACERTCQQRGKVEGSIST